MGTRTAPAINGTPVFKRVSITHIDASGDVRTISTDVAGDATAAEVETLVAAQQALTQASVYQVEIAEVYAGQANTTNATNLQRSSVYDQVIYRAKNPTVNLAYSWEAPAPVLALLIGDSDVPVNPSALNTALFNALGALKAAGYAFKSIRYTERKEINKAIKI